MKLGLLHIFVANKIIEKYGERKELVLIAEYVEWHTHWSYFVKVVEALTNDYGDYEKLSPNRINEI